MAQRFKAEQLKEMIRVLVREEIKDVVKATINEVLSERYLKELAEVAASRPRGVSRTLHIADGDDAEEEGVPQILANTTRGIYGRHPIKHSDSIDDDEAGQEGPKVTTIPEGHERDEFMSLFFEGTKPINEMEREAGVDDLDDSAAMLAEMEGQNPMPEIPDVPLPHRKDPAKKTKARRTAEQLWTTLAGVKPGQQESPERQALNEEQDRKKMQELEEKRLERLRASLDVPAYPGAKPQ